MKAKRTIKLLLPFMVMPLFTLANGTMENSAYAKSANRSADTLFFEEGATWYYLDDGTDQDTMWRVADFDDSAWAEGTGHMGFGEGDEDTELTSGFITYYFRKKVNVPSASELGEVYFNIIHDDGAVLYINGTEAARSALMPEGEITYTTGTSTYIPNDQENSYFTYKVDASLFVDGENVVAIEVHNQKTTSSDVSFNCYVTSDYVEEFDLDGPYVFYRDDKVIVKSISAEGLVEQEYASAGEASLVCYFPDGERNFTVEIQPEHPIEASEYELPEKYLAFSDIEGSLEAFAMLMEDAGVMDKDFNWTYGNGHLVFVGDMFDRGTNVTECLWLLYRLEYLAEAQGGKVHFILGNHDVMNLIGDFRYVAQKYIDNVALMGETLSSINAEDTEMGKWLRSKNLIEKAGDFIFVHGGLSPAVANLGLSYDTMNEFGRKKIAGDCTSSNCQTVTGGSASGLFWYRSMAKEELTQDQVNNIMQKFEGKHVLIGHTVFPEITLLYNTHVVAIDLHHADNYLAGYMEAFVYKNDSMYSFKTTGSDKTYQFLTTVLPVSDKRTGMDLDINVYPNPVKNVAKVEFAVPAGLAYKPIKITVTSADGREVRKIDAPGKPQGKQQTDIKLCNIPEGVYYVIIDIANERNSMSFIVN
jgi:hypothetical protein